MSDLDKLREKAQAATPGPWPLMDRGPAHDFDQWHYVGDVKHIEIVRAGFADAAYIAAADPTTVLALIDRLQRVETALDDALAANCKGLGTGVSTILVAAGAKASAYDVAAMRCDKCGQKLASDEDDGEPYCLNCETCSRCQGIHHMEDRCQDATDAEAALSQRDAELATVVEALRHIAYLGSSVPPGMEPESFYHLEMNEAIKTAAIALHPDLGTSAERHDERIRQAALSQFTPEQIAEALCRPHLQHHVLPKGGRPDLTCESSLAIAAALYAALTEKPQETPQ